MYRDNTKAYTPTLKACYGGEFSVMRDGVTARPGKRNNRVPAAAGSVSSVNGKTPGPGYKQKKPAGAGPGTIARPGFHQKIKG